MSRLPSLAPAFHTAVDRGLLAADAKMTARRFWVQIGVKNQAPRLTFGCFAADAVSANLDAQDEALPGERIEVVPAGELTEADLEEIDAQYHQRKVSGELRARDDRHAVAADLTWLDKMRRVGAL